MAWTGSFRSRRELLGIKLRWSYAPAEVKVLTSADGGNFEEASRWRRTARTEPSFEETIMFATPVSVKAVKVLMRGAKPWGYFGLSTVAAVAAPYSFMLVSGAAAIHEQCVVSTPAGLSAKPCVDAIVAGDGHEVFGLTSAGSLQDVSGRCVALEAGKVEFRQCSNVGRSVGDDRGGASQTRQHVLGTGRPGCCCHGLRRSRSCWCWQPFSGGRAKVRPSSCRWSSQPRQACASKRCKAEQALGHVKFAHAEACHLQDQSQFDGKAASQPLPQWHFLPIMLWAATRAPGVADKIGVQFGVAQLPTFTC